MVDEQGLLVWEGRLQWSHARLQLQHGDGILRASHAAEQELLLLRLIKS